MAKKALICEMSFSSVFAHLWIDPIEQIPGVHLAEALQSMCFISDPGIPGVRSMGPSVTNSCFVDLTDITLVDEDTNSILADDTNRAIPGNLELN